MLALDVLLILLICLCIFYCIVLNKRVLILQNNKSEFDNLLKRFDDAVTKSEANIKLLNETSFQVGNITSKCDIINSKAGDTSNDLSFLNDVATKTFEKLERSMIEAKSLDSQIQSVINAMKDACDNNHGPNDTTLQQATASKDTTSDTKYESETYSGPVNKIQNEYGNKSYFDLFKKINVK